jgi:hypothetical protein
MKILVELNPLKVEKVNTGFLYKKDKAFFLFDDANEAKQFVTDHFTQKKIHARNQLRTAENQLFEALELVRSL